MPIPRRRLQNRLRHGLLSTVITEKPFRVDVCSTVAGRRGARLPINLSCDTAAGAIFRSRRCAEPA